MANELVAASGNSTALANPNYNPFLQAAEDEGVSAVSGSFMKFNGNSGEFTAGKENDEIAHGTRLAVNANEFKRGWICWNDGKVEEQIMVRVTEGRPPSKGDLTDHGPYVGEKDGWSEQSSVALRDVETGDEYTFQSSSKSGRMAVANLLRDYGKQFQFNPGKLAVVELGATSFIPKNAPKSAGKKYAPEFKIVDWQDEAELIAKFADAAGDNPEDYDDDGDEPAPPPPKPEAGTGRRARRF